MEHISSIEKDLSSDYTMSCIASGKPKPRIRWMRDGQLVILKLISLYCRITEQLSYSIAVNCSEPHWQLCEVSQNLFAVQPGVVTVAQQ